MEDSWTALLSAPARRAKPWLIEPTRPVQSDEHRATSYAELADDARAIAAGLRAHGIERGDAIVLIVANTRDCCRTILAALTAGVAVVPSPPPPLGQELGAWRLSLQRRYRDSGARAIVCGEALHGLLHSELSLLETNALHASGITHPCELPAARAEDVAVVQYTSGTTGAARGAELSHTNVFANLRAIGHAVEVGARDAVACWLPLFHDMGLIGSLLFATYYGLPFVLLSPRTFALRPEAWLWAIARFGVTCSAAPSSAYELCATRIAERKIVGLDLSRWRVAVNGGELIQPRTLERFAARFAPHGFAADALRPTYGLAENTVAVSFTNGPARSERLDRASLDRGSAQLSTDPRRQREVTSVGRAVLGHELRVVDAEGRRLDDRCVGELQVRGPSTTRGYRGRPASESSTADGWLRTGDRAYLVAGELFVVGRAKQIVKVGGRAIDAAHLEMTLRTELALGSVAVFGLAEHARGEQLVVLIEQPRLSDEAARALISAVERWVRAEVDLTPDQVHLVAPGSIPRTSSGKIRHGEARRRFEEENVCERS